MKVITKITSYLSLVLLIGSPLLFFFQKISFEKNKDLMLIATITWFSSTIFQAWKEKEGNL